MFYTMENKHCATLAPGVLAAVPEFFHNVA